MENEIIQSLKDFINLKFESMEEKFALKNAYNEEKIDSFERKIDSLSERIYKLEQLAIGADKKTIQKIKDSILNWLVPFIMGAILFYISKGGK